MTRLRMAVEDFGQKKACRTKSLAGCHGLTKEAREEEEQWCITLDIRKYGVILAGIPI